MSTNKDFRQKMLELTKENLKNSRQKISKKQLFHEMLLDNKMERNDIVFELSMKTIELKIDGELDSSNQEHIEMFNKIYKTCKNSVDTMVSNSNNTATYKNDPSYSGFELKREGHIFWIEKVQNKNQKNK